MSQPLESESADREVCVCFHVPLGKLVAFARRREMRVVSQFAECHGAGTGCGWCVPFLEKLHGQLAAGEPPQIGMTPEEYRCRRAEYRQAKKPMLPPSPDAEAPLALDLGKVLDEVPGRDRLE